MAYPAHVMHQERTGKRNIILRSSYFQIPEHAFSLCCFKLSQVKDTNINQEKCAVLDIKLLCIHKPSLGYPLPSISSIFLSLLLHSYFGKKDVLFVSVYKMKNFFFFFFPILMLQHKIQFQDERPIKKLARTRFSDLLLTKKILNMTNTENMSIYRTPADTVTVSPGSSCFITIALHRSDLK